MQSSTICTYEVLCYLLFEGWEEFMMLPYVLVRVKAVKHLHQRLSH